MQDTTHIAICAETWPDQLETGPLDEAWVTSSSLEFTKISRIKVTTKAVPDSRMLRPTREVDSVEGRIELCLCRRC
jgi:hypothetical protein